MTQEELAIETLSRLSDEAKRLGYTLVKTARIKTLSAQQTMTHWELQGLPEFRRKEIENHLQYSMGRAVGEGLIRDGLITFDAVDVDHGKGFRSTVRVIIPKPPEEWL